MAQDDNKVEKLRRPQWKPGEVRLGHIAMIFGGMVSEAENLARQLNPNMDQVDTIALIKWWEANSNLDEALAKFYDEFCGTGDVKPLVQPPYA